MNSQWHTCVFVKIQVLFPFGFLLHTSKGHNLCFSSLMAWKILANYLPTQKPPTTCGTWVKAKIAVVHPLSATCPPSCICPRLHCTYTEMHFGMDTGWQLSDAKWHFSFIYNRSHSERIAPLVENQNGIKLLSTEFWSVKLNMSLRNSFWGPLFWGLGLHSPQSMAVKPIGGVLP